MQAVGGYQLIKRLGQGATAQVFLARDAKTEVALKVFHPGIWDQEDLRRRAQSEFKATASLSHPNIVRVLKPLWDLDPPAVALEYVDGFSLEEFQPRLPYILPEVGVLIVIEVLEALSHAHTQGIIHRDLKPANILISQEGRVLVSDFGLAKITDVSRLTLSGTILGSPDFMSPEQARGDITRASSDLFSAAALLYFLVTGTRPFNRGTPLATLAAVSEAKTEPPQRRNPKLSAALAKLITRGLSRYPDSRFQSADDFAGELRRYLQELGLTAANFNLKAWVRNPADVTFSALRAIAEGLTHKAEKQIAGNLGQEALETLAHLSLVAPDSGSLVRCMDLLEEQRRRRRRKRVLGWCSAGASAAIALVFAWSLHRREPAPTPAPRAAALGNLGAPAYGAGSPGQPAIAVPAPDPAALQAEPRIVKPPREARPAHSGIVVFNVPEEVAIYWDGHPVKNGKPLLGQRLGEHELRLEKPGSRPILQSISVEADEPTVIRVH